MELIQLPRISRSRDPSKNSSVSFPLTAAPARQEWRDEFLALFPHRFDYIWAEHPVPGQSPEWKTESRYPLSDRLIQQSSYLYGVRFGSETTYCLLDIDSGSLYHPKRDPFAISRIVAALEPLGLVDYLACTSSYSGGLHLYFPFQHPQSSWKLAIAVTTLLENAGFKPRPGQLEVFPDPKPYRVNGQPSLFNAHRLPLQVGSYLLNQEFQPIWTDQPGFLQQWRFAQTRNDVEAVVIRRVLKQIQRRHYAVSTKAEKFINDLNAEIELGWTGYGQTNYLLGRITMREYIFHHVLAGGQPLSGEALVEAIVEVARSLPGYAEYCRHQHEIEHRAEEWARCIENSHYFHYGDAAGKFKAKPEDTPLMSSDLEGAIENAPNWNQQQLESARERIRRAIAQLLEQGALPANATARFHALVKAGIGGGTLYKHRDLWHPHHLGINHLEINLETDLETEVAIAVATVEIPPHPPASLDDRGGDCNGSASPPHCHTSLLSSAGSNPLTSKASGDLGVPANVSGRNLAFPQLPEPANSIAEPAALIAAISLNPEAQTIQQVRLQIQAAHAARQAALQLAYEQQQHLKQQAAEARQIARMQQFLDSNDPILMAEAIAWAQINPGLLDTSSVCQQPSGEEVIGPSF